MIAHVATLEGTPEQLREFVARLSSEVSPVIATRPGFIESIALVDATGGGMLITLWESQAAADASAEQWRKEGATTGVSERVGLRRQAQWYELALVTRLARAQG
jgi:heme-degrading monooxygenase HmoA